MKKESSSILGNNIRKLRKFYNISAETLGKACGVNKDTVLRWKRDETIPSAYIISRIEEIFNVPKNVLLRKNIKIEEKDERNKDYESN